MEALLNQFQQDASKKIFFSKNKNIYIKKNIIKKGSFWFAKETANLISQVVDQQNFSEVYEVLEVIYEIKQTLKKYHPLQFTVTNIIRRTMMIIVEQCRALNIEIKNEGFARLKSIKIDLKLINLFNYEKITLRINYFKFLKRKKLCIKNPKKNI